MFPRLWWTSKNKTQKKTKHTHKRQHGGKPEATLYSQAWGNNLGPHTSAALTIRRVWYPEDSQQQQEFSKVSKMCWATETCLLRSGCLKRKRKHCYVTWMLFWRISFHGIMQKTTFKSDFLDIFCPLTSAFGNSSHKLDFYPAELYLPTLFLHFFIATVNLAGEP